MKTSRPAAIYLRFLQLTEAMRCLSRITSMRKKGWILLADTSDVRRKPLERLSRCLVEAAKGGWKAGRKT